MPSRRTSRYRKQSIRWSLTIPTACMWPYITVDPTKLNPRRFRSRLNASDSRVVGGDLTHGFPTILSRATVDELPAICVEAAKLPLHRQKRSSVLDRGGDLQAVPDDPGIGGQLVDPNRGVPRDLLRIEVAERATVALALVEDDRPTESRLCGFQNQELEMCAIVMRRHPPFAIVILAHQHLIDVDP